MVSDFFMLWHNSLCLWLLRYPLFFSFRFVILIFICCYDLNLKCPLEACVLPTDGAFGRWLDYEGSDFTIIWLHCNLVSLLGSDGGMICPRHPPVCLSASWLSCYEQLCFTTCSPPWSSVSLRPKVIGPCDYGLKPLKQWTKIQLPSFKLFFSGFCHSNRKTDRKLVMRSGNIAETTEDWKTLGASLWKKFSKVLVYCVQSLMSDSAEDSEDQNEDRNV
jgi:hypothetical protein